MLIKPNDYVNHTKNKVLHNVHMTKQTRKERILEVIADQGLNQSKFAAGAGVTRATVTNWLNNETIEIKSKHLQRIESSYGVNGKWVDLGIGDKLVAHKESNIESAPSSQGEAPLISWVQAGNWCEAVGALEFGDAELWLPCPARHGGNAYILRVRGDSMETKYHDGDLVFVDPDRQPDHGSDVIVRLNNAGEATFKQLQIDGDNQYLVARNKTYPNPVIPMSDEAEICGVVIFAGKFT